LEHVKEITHSTQLVFLHKLSVKIANFVKYDDDDDKIVGLFPSKG
jgi:hypothetical protein